MVDNPLLSPVITANISSSLVRETLCSTNTPNKKILISLPEFTSTKEATTGKCTEVSIDNYIESQKLPNEKQTSQDSTNRNDLSKIPTMSMDSKEVYNVKIFKLLSLKQVLAKINSDNKLFIGKTTSPFNSPYQLEEENSDKNEDFSGTDSGDVWQTKKINKIMRVMSRSSSSSPSSSSSGSSSSSTSSSSSSSTSNSSTSVNKRKTRTRNVAAWKKNKTKSLKNSGKEYISRTGKTIQAKSIKPPCSEKCRLSCFSKFTPIERKKLFHNYWQRQRDFISFCTTVLEVPFRRIKATVTKERKPNCCFSFLRDGKASRVCKTFLINTLGIGERTLRTVTEAKTSGSGITPIDRRGKHSKHRKLDPEVSQSVRDHINSISRIESHYLRANTSREFIDGGLTIAEMHRHYTQKRDSLGKVAANYDLFATIFNTEFNISFFIPKKDQCDVCEAYKNADGQDKLFLEEDYKKHQQQKEQSRKEKKSDVNACREANSSSLVAIYDLQAVMPIPMGETHTHYHTNTLLLPTMMDD